MISIIVPCFNSGKTVGACLRSLRDQSSTLFEVIIVDGRSTDDTSLVVKQEVGEDKRFSFHSENDSGVYDAINKGIQRSSGDWIYILGSDDRLESQETLELVENHLTSEVDFVYFDVFRPDRSDSQPMVSSALDLAGRNICQQAILYRRSLFELVGPFELKYRICADWKFNIECLAYGARMKRVDFVIARYSGSGLSSQSTDEPFYDDVVSIF
jgi:glycosyltransferase involved in cell wall biosynthesis